MTSPASSTSSISGLISGMDTTSVISQLMQIESQPQTMLKSQLSATQTDAAAYRDVNSAFAALSTAAQALTQSATWAAAKATSSSSTVTASASTTAVPGSVSFTVDALATTKSLITSTSVTKTTDSANLGTALTLTKGGATSTITVTDTTGTGNPSLDDVVSAINKSGSGLTANTINTGNGYLLQVTGAGSGTANDFSLAPTTGSTNGFATLTSAGNAQITLGAGGAAPTTITSATNTFDGVLSGTTFTVGQVTPSGGAATVVGVAADPDAIANAVQALVTAANNVLSKIHSYTDSSTGSVAPLKGDTSLTSLTGQVLDAVSSSVGTAVLDANGKPITSSAGSNGVQLDRYGKLVFSAADFKTALAANPARVQAVFGGATANGADGIPNTADDTLSVDGVAARLARLSNQASDSASGILTGLANGQDTRGKDIQSQIDAWTLRLQARQQTLTAQFTAMETALGTLKNQSSWLTSQINSLPTMSSTPSH